MGLFSKKNSNYNDNDAKLRQIEYDFETDDLAKKFEFENFATGSILFVKPGQEAVVYSDGNVETFEQGRYELSTENLRGFDKIYNNKFVSGNNIYRTYVYFINKDKAIQCYFGTPSPIPIYSDKYKSTFRIIARGSYKLIVDNSIKFISNTIGQLSSYKMEDIDEFMFNEVMQVISSKLSELIVKDKIPFDSLSSETSNLSKRITTILKDENVFENYGLKLKANIAFDVITLHPDDYEKVQELDAKLRDLEAKRQEIETLGLADANAKIYQGNAEATNLRNKGFAEADVMKAKGEYYAQERSFDVLEKAAENPGSAGGNNFLTSGINLGMSLGLGQQFSKQAADMAKNAFNNNNNDSNQIICPKCNFKNSPNAKFCNNCGEKFNAGIVCPSCGFENDKNAKFCNNCGFKLISKKVCPSCGFENDLNAKFCNSCGFNLNEDK